MWSKLFKGKSSKSSKKSQQITESNSQNVAEVNVTVGLSANPTSPTPTHKSKWLNSFSRKRNKEHNNKVTSSTSENEVPKSAFNGSETKAAQLEATNTINQNFEYPQKPIFDTLVEPLEVNVELHPCPICTRTFKPTTLVKHVNICEKMAQKKRKKFDSSRQRREGTDLADFLPVNFGLPQSKIQEPKLSPKTVQSPPLIVSKKVDELAKSPTALVHKKAASPVAQISSVPPKERMQPAVKRALSIASEQCPYCERCFGVKAFDRHVEWCKEKARLNNSQTNTTLNRAKERLQARTKYRAPCLKTKRAANREKYSGMSCAGSTNSLSDGGGSGSRSKSKANSEERKMSMSTSLCSSIMSDSLEYQEDEENKSDYENNLNEIKKTGKERRSVTFFIGEDSPRDSEISSHIDHLDQKSEEIEPNNFTFINDKQEVKYKNTIDDEDRFNKIYQDCEEQEDDIYLTKFNTEIPLNENCIEEEVLEEQEIVQENISNIISYPINEKSLINEYISPRIYNKITLQTEISVSKKLSTKIEFERISGANSPRNTTINFINSPRTSSNKEKLENIHESDLMDSHKIEKSVSNINLRVFEINENFKIDDNRISIKPSQVEYVENCGRVNNTVKPKITKSIKSSKIKFTKHKSRNMSREGRNKFDVENISNETRSICETKEDSKRDEKNVIKAPQTNFDTKITHIENKFPKSSILKPHKIEISPRDCDMNLRHLLLHNELSTEDPCMAEEITTMISVNPLEVKLVKEQFRNVHNSPRIPQSKISITKHCIEEETKTVKSLNTSENKAAQEKSKTICNSRRMLPIEFSLTDNLIEKDMKTNSVNPPEVKSAKTKCRNVCNNPRISVSKFSPVEPCIVEDINIKNSPNSPKVKLGEEKSKIASSSPKGPSSEFSKTEPSIMEEMKTNSVKPPEVKSPKTKFRNVRNTPKIPQKELSTTEPYGEEEIKTIKTVNTSENKIAKEKSKNICNSPRIPQNESPTKKSVNPSERKIAKEISKNIGNNQKNTRDTLTTSLSSSRNKSSSKVPPALSNPLKEELINEKSYVEIELYSMQQDPFQDLENDNAKISTKTEKNSHTKILLKEYESIDKKKDNKSRRVSKSQILKNVSEKMVESKLVPTKLKTTAILRKELELMDEFLKEHDSSDILNYSIHDSVDISRQVKINHTIDSKPKIIENQKNYQISKPSKSQYSCKQGDPPIVENKVNINNVPLMAPPESYNLTQSKTTEINQIPYSENKLLRKSKISRLNFTIPSEINKNPDDYNTKRISPPKYLKATNSKLIDLYALNDIDVNSANSELSVIPCTIPSESLEYSKYGSEAELQLIYGQMEEYICGDDFPQSNDTEEYQSQSLLFESDIIRNTSSNSEHVEKCHQEASLINMKKKSPKIKERQYEIKKTNTVNHLSPRTISSKKIEMDLTLVNTDEKINASAYLAQSGDINRQKDKRRLSKKEAELKQSSTEENNLSLSIRSFRDYETDLHSGVHISPSDGGCISSESFVITGLSDKYDPFLSAKRQLEELCSPSAMTKSEYSYPTSTPLAKSKKSMSPSAYSSNPTNTLNSVKSNFRRTSSLRVPRKTGLSRPVFIPTINPPKPTIQRGISDEGPISHNFLKPEEYDEMPVKSVCVNDFAARHHDSHSHSPKVVKREHNSNLNRRNLKLNLSHKPDDKSGDIPLSKTDSLAVFLKYESESKSFTLPKTLTEKDIKDKSNSLSRQTSLKNSSNELHCSQNDREKLASLKNSLTNVFEANSEKLVLKEPNSLITTNKIYPIKLEPLPKLPASIISPSVQSRPLTLSSILDDSKDDDYIDPKLINVYDNLPINVAKLSDSEMTSSSTESNGTTKILTESHNQIESQTQTMLSTQSQSVSSNRNSTEKRNLLKRQIRLGKNQFLYDMSPDSDPYSEQCDKTMSIIDSDLNKNDMTNNEPFFDDFDFEEFISSFEDDEQYPIFKDYKEFLSNRSINKRSNSSSQNFIRSPTSINHAVDYEVTETEQAVQSQIDSEENMKNEIMSNPLGSPTPNMPIPLSPISPILSNSSGGRLNISSVNDDQGYHLNAARISEQKQNDISFTTQDINQNNMCVLLSPMGEDYRVMSPNERTCESAASVYPVDSDEISSVECFPVRRNVQSKQSADSAYGSLSRHSPVDRSLRRNSTRSRQQTANSVELHHSLSKQKHSQKLDGKSRSRDISASSSGSDTSLPPIQSQIQTEKYQDLDKLKRDSRMSKFCHECGNRFLVNQAKFCMECGVRRIVVE